MNKNRNAKYPTPTSYFFMFDPGIVSVDQVETGQENVKDIQLVGDTKVIPLGILFSKLFVKFNKKWMKVSTNTLTPVY